MEYKKMFCGNCGSKIENGADYCPDCGKSTTERNKSINSGYNMVSKNEKETPLLNKILGVISLIIGIIWYILFYVTFSKSPYVMQETASLLFALNGSVFVVGSLLLFKIK